MAAFSYHSALDSSMSPELATDSHNVHVYCVEGKWHNRRHFITYSKPSTRVCFFYNPKGLLELCVILSICLPTQKLLEYLLAYASIPQAQKPYQAHPANSTKCDCLALL